jgi:hypothetical protein
LLTFSLEVLERRGTPPLEMMTITAPRRAARVR